MSFQLTTLFTLQSFPMLIREMRTLGTLQNSNYYLYLLAGNHFCEIMATIGLFIGAQFFASGGDYFLSKWWELHFIANLVFYSVSEKLIWFMKGTPNKLQTTLHSETGVLEYIIKNNNNAIIFATSYEALTSTFCNLFANLV